MPDWDVRITPIKYGNYHSTYAKPNAMSNSHLAMVGIPAFYGQFLRMVYPGFYHILHEIVNSQFHDALNCLYTPLTPPLFKSHISTLMVHSFLPSLGFKQDPQKTPINFYGKSPAGTPRPIH